MSDSLNHPGPTGKCPECGRILRVTATLRLFAHKSLQTVPEFDFKVWRPCPGSGNPQQEKAPWLNP